MKGRKLPLGGTPRSHPSSSECEANSPGSDTPAARTRLRSPPSSPLDPPDKAPEIKEKGLVTRLKSPEQESELPGQKGSTYKTRTKRIDSEGPPTIQDFTTDIGEANVGSGETSANQPTIVNSEDGRTAPVEDGTPSVDTNGRAHGDNSKTRNGTSQDPVTNSQKRPFSPGEMPSLIAVEAGRMTATTVRLMINGLKFVPVSPGYENNASPSVVHGLGHDGNQYYCQVCHEFGNVVCCDGCPRVYHKGCIPAENPARKSLDNDEDPWFCPYCIKQHKKPSKTSKTSTRLNQRHDKSDRRTTSQNRCVDCGQDNANLKIEPCHGCGNYVHFPSCFAGDPKRHGKKVLCSTCRAVEELTKEEEDLHEVTERSMEDLGKRGRSSRAAKSKGESSRRNDFGLQDERDYEDDDEDEVGDGVTRRKRKRVNSVSKREKKKKKTKKKSKSLQSSPTNDQIEEVDDVDDLDDLYPTQVGTSGGVRAIPAFYFYLAENRWKIERVLARKHRYFNRLPKGRERNEVVAREAAMWWVKLRPTDHRRYMTMSMRDLEARIMEWKEERNLKEMLSGDAVTDSESVAVTRVPQRSLHEDEKMALERHEKRFRGTSVGSKPFKPEPGHSYNRVLLDLLHDMRFHPFPMVGINRTDIIAEADKSRAAIPFFEVHGPVSTSVGDECLGCSRGWRHFCPVLKRAMPAVEHRAKLQPPLSSLMATRVGLGLRPPLERVEEQEGDRNEKQAKEKEHPLFVWRSTSEKSAIDRLPVIPSSSLTDASERFDDIVHVIEETTAMKVKEPPPPQVSEQSPKTSMLRTLPTQRGKGQDDEQTQNSWHKCGRCRTVSESELGCLQCRRAQFVINMTKKQPHSNASSKHEGKALKVQTVMLGRVQMREGTGETQPAGEQAVANFILKQRWTPMAVMGPHKQRAPAPSEHSVLRDSLESNEESSTESDSDDSAQGDSQRDSLLKKRGVADQDDVKVPPLESKQQQDRSRTRLPPTRLLVSSASTKDYNGTNRLEETERNQKSEALNTRCLAIASYGILQAVLRRDPLKLFSTPATDEDHMDTSKNPIEFGAIREKVLGCAYSSLDELLSDLRLLCKNALTFYPAYSVHWKTAKDISDLVPGLETKTREWLAVLNQAYDAYLLRQDKLDDPVDSDESGAEDPFAELRLQWPEAVEMLEQGESLRNQINADFIRTKENETAFYGTLAIRRASIAAEASLAPYSNSSDTHAVVIKRTMRDDEELRNLIDTEVEKMTDPVELGQVSSSREESLVRLLRKVQSRRMERKSFAENSCSRCIGYDADSVPTPEEPWHTEHKKRRNTDDGKRVDASRILLKTGLGSAKICKGIVTREEGGKEAAYDFVKDCRLSVRASEIHGMGLFADQAFKKGDVVTEYVGEYISGEVADAREKKYHEERRQDFIYRINDKLAIDATLKGGPARFMNHNCEPNCYTKVITGSQGKEQLQRVILLAQNDIEINEEITFDYHIPLELDLAARIPCHCQSDACRGFMVCISVA